MLRRLFIFSFLMGIAGLGVARKPVTFIWNSAELDSLRQNPQSPGFQSIVQHADKMLNESIVAVTDKPHAISGDKHNYESLATYYWPVPGQPDAPWVPQDGKTNPLINEYDFQRLLKLKDRCLYLSKAYFLTRDRKYHKAFCRQLDTWFLKKQTCMSPNLEYSQFAPGNNNNRGMPGGVLDANRLVDVVESIYLTNSVKSIGKRRMQKLKRWFADLGQWMQTSENGRRARNFKNNHAIAFDGTLLCIGLFTNDSLIQTSAIDDFCNRHIPLQIEEDGRMPQELVRPNAFTYSIFNLHHIIDFCLMMKGSGRQIPPQVEERVSKCADYLAPFIGRKTAFPYKEIGDWNIQEQELKRQLRRFHVQLMDRDSNLQVAQ